MSPTTCRNSLDDSNNICDEIEKFLCEYEIPTASPPLPKKNRIYTKIDLLNVLGSENSDKDTISLMSVKSQKPQVPTCPVIPKKRKEPQKETKQEPPIKKPVKDVLLKKNGKPRKRVGRPRKLLQARERNCIEPKLYRCHRICEPKIKKIARVCVHVLNRHKAKVDTVISRCDSQTVRNIVVKKEIIDLTENDSFLCVFLKFGKVCSVETETVEPFGRTLVKAKVVEAGDYLNKVSVFVPKVQFDVDNAYIDLTEIDDNDENNLVVASEKECANRILPILYKYHKLHEAHKKMEDAIREIREYLPIQDDCYPFKLFSSLGLELVRELSHIFVKNLNLSRFIEILVLKLEISFRVSLKPHSVYFYLNMLLNPHRDTCGSRLLTEILKGVDEYFEFLKIKEERNREGIKEVVITEEQLIELRLQIGKYIEIAIRQQELMADYNEQKGLSVITKEVKEEFLSFQRGVEYLQDVKVENDILCILDD